VLLHDVTPKPPMDCGKAYVVAKTSWATLRARCRTRASASDDHGRYPLPRFDETTAQVAAVPGAQLFAEVKVAQSSAQARAFYQTLADHQMVDRTVVTSFFPAELAKMQAAAKGAGTHLRLMLFVRDHSVSAAEAKKAGLWAVAVRHDAVDAAYVKSLHRAGITVIAWTPNERKEWAAVTAAGVDQVLTDQPGDYLAWRGRS
jgi:glycerophosphoryl diester phosphodiesterase